MNEKYDLALHKMGGRNGIKLIIHITHAGAHPEQGILLPALIEKCVNENINGFKISDYPKRSFDKITELYNDYKL